MKISSLRVFLSVLECGSISGASRVEYITQPAVSSIVRALEEEIGTPLLVRSPGQRNQIVPTPAGRIFSEYARKALHDYHNVCLDIAKAEDEPMTVSAVSSPTIATTILPSLLKHFSMEYPQIKVNNTVVSHFPEREMAGTEAPHYDVGFSPSRPKSSNVTYERFFYDPIVAICPKSFHLDHKITLREFRRLPIVSRPPGGKVMEQIERELAKARVDYSDLNIVMHVNGDSDVLQAVSMDSGIGFITHSLFSCSSNVENISLLQIYGLELKRYLYLVLRKGHTLNSAANLFVDYTKSMSWRDIFRFDTTLK